MSMIAKRVGNKAAACVREAALSGKSPTLSVLATYIDHKQHQKKCRKIGFNPKVSTDASEYVKEIRKNGICVIENYWNEDQCASAREDTDRLIKEFPEYVHPNAKADKRIYGANNASNIINEFNTDPLLSEVANLYNEEPTKAAFTLAARMPYTPNNLGSGEGWHRDAPIRQFKAIMYLSDVTLDNGPFQMISNSHSLKNVLIDTWRGKLNYPQFRVSQEQVEKLISKHPQRLTTYTATAGTVILADVSSIHRGMPITSGTRYALTNYFFPTDAVDESLFTKFKAIPSAR